LSLYFNWAALHEDVLGEWRYRSTNSLTSALERGEWSASRPGRFTPRDRTPVTRWIVSWVGARAGLDTISKKKSPSPHRHSNPVHPARSQSLYWLSHHGSPLLNLTPRHKDVLESVIIAPRILNLGTRWWWVVSFTPRPLYSLGKSPYTHWTGGWVGLRAGLDTTVRERYDELFLIVLLNERKMFEQGLDQWYSTGGTRTPRGTRRHLMGYVKFKISIYILFHEWPELQNNISFQSELVLFSISSVPYSTQEWNLAPTTLGVQSWMEKCL
jgi:hypothetical protein